MDIKLTFPLCIWLKKKWAIYAASVMLMLLLQTALEIGHGWGGVMSTMSIAIIYIVSIIMQNV